MNAQSLKFNCKNCGHLVVCKIYPNLQSLVQQLFPEGTQQTIAAENAANICKQFIPHTVIELSDQAQNPT
jgi:hypothetical protein